MSVRRRLFCALLPDAGGEVTLAADVANHIRVLRLAVGASVCLFDGAGQQAEGEIVSLSPAVVRVGRPVAVRSSERRRVLCLGLPKGAKLDGIVRGVTELGVSEVRLLRAERSVARPPESRAARRLERLEKIAAEAARQSGRADVPTLVAPAALTEIVAAVPESAARLAFVPGSEESPEARLGTERGEVWLVVGPEGGLSESERTFLRESGFAEVGLGPLTLRVETAALVAVARTQLR